MKRRTLLKIIGAFIALEAASCALLYFTNTVPNAPMPDPMPAYHTWDNATNTLALTPNTTLTYAELLAELRRTGQASLSAVLDVELSMHNTPLTEVGLAINESGLRASEVVPNADLTVLLLSDSTAFGLMQNRTYADFLQKYLNKNIPQLSIQILNASVPSHTTKDVVDRLPTFATLKPDVVAVYLGINDLYHTPPTTYGLPTFTLRLVGKFAPQLNQLADTGVLKTLAGWRMQFETPQSIKNLTKIAKFFNKTGAKVVFITPAMLVDTPQQTPDFSHDKIAQSLPQWTQNPQLLGLYNRRLTQAMVALAPKLGADVIHASDWLAITVENQRAFYDNVHLTSTGADAFSQFLASGLRNTLENVYLEKQAKAAAAAEAESEAQ